MTLREQLDELRQLASMSSNARLLDVALINALDELAQAVEELRDGDPHGPGVSWSAGEGTSPAWPASSSP